MNEPAWDWSHKQVFDDTIGQKIVDLVNATLDKEYTYDGRAKGDILIKNKNGHRGMIICYNGATSDEYFIRSVIFPKNRFRPFGFLCNGQAGTNARQIAFWPETHLIYELTDEEIKRRMELSFGENVANVIAKGIVPDPYAMAVKMRARRAAERWERHCEQYQKTPLG
jgi:hypothetical protein